MSSTLSNDIQLEEEKKDELRDELMLIRSNLYECGRCEDDNEDLPWEGCCERCEMPLKPEDLSEKCKNLADCCKKCTLEDAEWEAHRKEEEEAEEKARIEHDILIKERNELVEINFKLRKDLDELNIKYANIEYYLTKAVDLTKKWKR